MKVLIAVDGSLGSLEAVDQLAPLLRPGSDELALYWSPPQTPSTSTSASDLVDRVQKSLAEAIFADVRKRLPAPLQSGVHTIVGTQDPRHGIVAAAEQWSANLIALGARGLSRLERLLLGSVSRSVVHAAKIPVWVARARHAPNEGEWRILWACEGPDTGRLSADVLARFTWPRGSTCRVLTVVPSLLGGRIPDWLQQQARSPDVESLVQHWTREHDQEVRDNLVRMEKFTRSLPRGCPTATASIAEGEPAREILAKIAEEEPGLVVVGAQHKRSMATIVFGSVAEAVLNHAACSVLVVPERATS